MLEYDESSFGHYIMNIYQKASFDKREVRIHFDQSRLLKSTHSTHRSEARGMLRVDTERRFLPRFKNQGLAPSDVSI